MSAQLHWLAGDERLRATLEAAIDGTRPASVIAETPRRRVLHLAGQTDSGPLLLKHFRARPSARSANSWKRVLGQSAGAREWRALDALAASEIPAPAPRAHARRGDEEWVAMDFVAGRPLVEAIHGASGAERRALVDELGLLVRRLHLRGLVHGDLHLANALQSDSGELVLLDWQRARLTHSRRAQARDLASLEFSLARAGLGRADRLRLRRSVLGTRASRATLLAAGQHVEAFAHDHYRGRTRRCLIEGRQQTTIDPTLGRGMRTRDLSEQALRAALSAHDAALAEHSAGVLKDDERARVTRVAAGGRKIVVKQVIKGGIGRRLADRLRGSPAERGWLGGHGLLARGIGAARPLAWLDRRDGTASVLLLEDVGERGCLDVARPDEIDPDMLARLLIALHRRGVDHGDLQASHIYGLEAPALIDLEGVRFRRRLGDEARLRSLAELNASLAESALPAARRCELFERYATALPFAMPRANALREVVRRSLARRHAWTGRDCTVVYDALR